MNTKISKTAIAALSVAIVAIVLGGFALAKPATVLKEVVKMGVDSVAGICSGSGNDPITQLCNIDINTLRVGTMSLWGSLTATGTSTLPVNTTIGSRISLTQVATTTYANGAAAGYYCNTGAELIVRDWMLDIKTNNGVFGSKWTIGTTTCSTYGSTCGNATASFVATTSATLMGATYIGTSTATTLWANRLGNAQGSFYSVYATGTPFVLKNGVCVVAYSDQAGVTSTLSWTAAAGFSQLNSYLYLNTATR